MEIQHTLRKFLSKNGIEIPIIIEPTNDGINFNVDKFASVKDKIVLYFLAQDLNK